MRTVEQLSAKKQLERETREQALKQQKLPVCETCCSYSYLSLGVHDDTSTGRPPSGPSLWCRAALGLRKIRDTLAELRRAAPELRDRAKSA